MDEVRDDVLATDAIDAMLIRQAEATGRAGAASIDFAAIAGGTHD